MSKDDLPAVLTVTLPEEDDDFVTIDCARLYCHCGHSHPQHALCVSNGSSTRTRNSRASSIGRSSRAPALSSHRYHTRRNRSAESSSSAEADDLDAAMSHGEHKETRDVSVVEVDSVFMG